MNYSHMSSVLAVSNKKHCTQPIFYLEKSYLGLSFILEILFSPQTCPIIVLRVMVFLHGQADK